MNLRDLRYLVAVADELHFGRASERCHVGQPTLSTQIKKLEAYLGIVVFERGAKSVTVTEIGKQLIEEARASIKHADALVTLAAAQRDPLSGSLELGAIPTLCPYLMPLILPALRQSTPAMNLVFSEDVTESLESQLRAGELDAALLATQTRDIKLVGVPLFYEPFWLATPTDHWLTEREEIGNADLHETDLLLLTDGHCLRDQALAICQTQAADEGDRRDDVRATSLQTLMLMVAAGYGCTLLPALAVSHWRGVPNIAIREINLPSARRRVSLVTRKSFSRMPAIHKVAEVICDATPDCVEVIGGANVNTRTSIHDA